MIIPRYPESRALELGDKDFLDSLFSSLQPRISELTFANLYLFRKAHAYRLTGCGNIPVILGRGYDGNEYFLPPLGENVADTVAFLLRDGRVLYGADSKFAEKNLEGRDYIELSEDRDAFDYLYLRKSLAELPGNLYHKKKNRINYFTARHEYRTEQFSPRHLEGTITLLERWRRIKSEMGGNSLELEVHATAEALQLAGRLGLEGVVVLVDGSVRAFALGERLNAETSVCHFEKADPFMDGLYQLVDREFNLRCFTDCAYVNREQDLGEPNLRKSKMSYHPVDYVMKYRAWDRRAR